MKALNPKLASEWNHEKNGELTPTTVSANPHQKVWWRCRKHGHSWDATVADRNAGCGCPYCSGRRLDQTNSLAALFPELSREWHPRRNSKTPQDFSARSNQVVWWLCSRTHEWQAKVNHRSSGGGCPYCAGRRTCPENCLQTLRPDLADEWHPAKNKPLTPMGVTPNSGKNVWWTCPIGHNWQARVQSRNLGLNCKLCSGKILGSNNSLAVLMPRLAIEWHPSKNRNLKPKEVTPQSTTVAWWHCKANHEWPAQISLRAKGLGCPYCAGRKLSPESSLAGTNPRVAKEWNFKRNPGLTPSQIAPNSNKKVWWLCRKNHEWQAIVANRNRGKDCPNCNNKQTSLAELRVLAEIQTIFPNAEHRGKFDGIECDILLRKQGLAIEVDGGYWHKGKESADRDKTARLRKLGIKLIRLRGKGLKKLSPSDILFREVGGLEALTLSALFVSISKEIALSATSKKTLTTYVRQNRFKNDTGFRKLLNRIPRPFPGRSLREVNPAVSRQWHKKKNGKLTAQDVYPNSSRSIWWQCNKNHEWEAKLIDRNHGNGCPYCSGKRVNGENCLASKNPSLAREWHPTKNAALTPKTVTPNSNKHAWWRCNSGHDWEATVANRNQGKGCPHCAGRGHLRPEKTSANQAIAARKKAEQVSPRFDTLNF